MPYVICPPCYTAYYVSENDINAVKEEHSSESHQDTSNKAEFIVFNTAREVTPPWKVIAGIAQGMGKWKPTRSIEG